MPNVQIVMIKLWCNPTDSAYVDRIAKYIALLNNRPVHLIDDAQLNTVSSWFEMPEFARYCIWKLVPPEVTHILYIDNDMLPLAPLPLSELPDVDIAAAPDRNETYQYMSERWPIIKRAGTYFNAGMFMASRKTEALFDHMLALQSRVFTGAPWFADQTMLNVEVRAAVERNELTFAALPKRWNSLVLIDEEAELDPYMLHFAGASSTKLRMIAQCVDRMTFGSLK